MFQRLFEPIQLGSTRIKNRIFNPPHGTTLNHRGKVTDDLIAYHEARARGGAGLIIIEGMTFHSTYDYKDAFVYAGDNAVIPGLSRLHKVCKAYDVPVFGQLFHAGRAVRLSHDGSKPLAYSASSVADERYRTIPVAMPNAMVWEIIDEYARAAGRLVEAGLDGVEILCSLGYLISQFLNPHTNRREDEFGGDFTSRMKFLREILSRTRETIGDDKTLGIRISLSEFTNNAMTQQDMLKICQAIEAGGMVDYFSVITGSSASPEGWVRVFPPMAIEPGFVREDAALLKAAVSKPVLVAGRINQPQLAEQILANESADMIGMVRGLIADPELPNKTKAGRVDDIRACIGCNQACVGHRLAHHPISCIQHPVSGRELELGKLKPAKFARNVWVIGGGPSGMKAAAIASARGHMVTLFEKTKQLGGQAILAQALPGRAEFGGVITNLKRELEIADVKVVMSTEVTSEQINSSRPDVVILATGARAALPEADIDGAHIVDSWSVIRGDINVGSRVVIADWACDWSGLGIAEKLARDGCHVRLMAGGIVPGESIQGIVRDHWVGELHKLGVMITPYARFIGADSDTAYFQHMTSGEPIICDGVDTIVSCFAPEPVNSLRDGLESINLETHIVGDAAAPRTVEEAVLEGFKAAYDI